jgi:hypothetical protein
MIGLEDGNSWCGAIKNSMDGGLRFREVYVSYSSKRKIFGDHGQPFAQFMSVTRTGSADGWSKLALFERRQGRDKHDHYEINVVFSP